RNLSRLRIHRDMARKEFCSAIAMFTEALDVSGYYNAGNGVDFRSATDRLMELKSDLLESVLITSKLLGDDSVTQIIIRRGR
ncbi:MAG: hypothetical protein ACRD63_15240, partial [Pyrinomonadaceae bacterium]